VKRIVWFIIGTFVGVYAVTRLKRRAQALAPQSLQASAEKVASAIRHFGDEVRAGMAERETELRDALGIDTATGTATGTVTTQTQREDYR
jgi:chromosome condensin MukBEF MukE localization factor